MNFHVLTLFPEMILQGMQTSITGRAMSAGLLSVNAVNIRDYAQEHRKGRVDDYPYGGGAGMVIEAEPVFRSWQSVCEKIGKEGPVRTVYMTPQGRVFNQQLARELAMEEDLILLCGHYEGIDERVIEEIVTDQISIGDYVLTGGELPAMVVMDAVSRMVPGVLTNRESGLNESFEGNLLEYPQYTRPEVWHDRKVPGILLSGHHANVERWRRDRSIERTWRVRPELLEGAELDRKDLQVLEEVKNVVDEPCKVCHNNGVQ